MYKTRRDTSEEINPAETFLSDFSPQELRENEVHSFKPSSLWYFVMVTQAKEHTYF